MELKLATDEQIAAAVIEGVRQTLRDPAFVRLVAAELAGELCWLTIEQVGQMLGRKRRTILRWLAKNKIRCSESLGPKDRKVKLADVQAAMDAGAIRAARPKAKPPGPKTGKPPVQTLLPTPVPLRAVKIEPVSAAG